MTHYLKTKQACCKGSCFHFYRGTSGLHRIFGVCLIMQVNYWVWWYSSIDFSCSLHRQVVIQVRVVHIYTSFPTNIFFTHSRNNNTVSLKISLLAMDIWAQEHEVQHLGWLLGSPRNSPDPYPCGLWEYPRNFFLLIKDFMMLALESIKLSEY